MNGHQHTRSMMAQAGLSELTIVLSVRANMSPHRQK